MAKCGKCGKIIDEGLTLCDDCLFDETSTVKRRITKILTILE